MSSDGVGMRKDMEAWERFLALMPDHREDQLLVILKGHLLIEELLRQIVDERVEKPAALQAARFECSHIISMAEALCAREIEPWVWVAVRKLNSLRNDIAHNLEPRGRKDRIDHLVSIVSNEFYIVKTMYAKDPPRQFEHALSMIFAKLTSLLKRAAPQITDRVPRK